MGAVVLRLGVLKLFYLCSVLLCISKTASDSSQLDVFPESFFPLDSPCLGGTVAAAGGILGVVELPDNWEHAVEED